jgi:regulator of protease activity HflC (stomatin/prohibitin superfamily)
MFKFFGSILAVSILFILIFVFFVFDIVRVNERQAVVITEYGKVVSIRNAGWGFKMPFISNTTYYDLSVRSISLKASSASKDQQTLEINVNVQYRLQAERVGDIFKLVQSQDFLETSIVPPLVQEAIKSIIPKYTTSELLLSRDKAKIEIEEALSKRLGEYYANVVAVNIENIDWSEAFDRAIEQKVIAEQTTQAKKQELEQAKLQADIEITKAKGQAEAIKIRGEAIKTNPEILEQLKIEKWNGVLPQVQSGEGGAGIIIDLPANFDSKPAVANP